MSVRAARNPDHRREMPEMLQHLLIVGLSRRCGD
jgi:hypothetical protein